ncbi:SMP-30/gluconolactonase/LRE family protein [Arthrobacter sp. Sa2CUA1]|uniref:SMP-30/gluconolactonase/LRE family protein n=1 Tax=Arthrobacter gallicola TaxID=2762225 RepID=A0ABR8UQC5_9MICC|nr:SMP-30/gluconolactonase/LRE family protein [Arthrobacter gallicola]MBD7994738.1 SMP-30/gluconolactonase/LRE family protein [Arthrobacter gallicola]
MSTEPWTRVSTHPHELGEGLRRSPGGVRWVDLLKGEMYAWTPGAQDSPACTHKLGKPLGMAEEDGTGRLLAIAGTGVVQLLDDGSDVPLADTGLDPARYRVNDGALAPDGSFWFGTMVHNGSEPDGALWRWDPADCGIAKVLAGIDIPNGPVFLPGGQEMLIADSAAGRILRSTLADPADTVPFAQTAGGSPDGMHVDGRGRIWNAVWGAARLDVYAPDATLLAALPLPVGQPTSVLLTDEPDPWILVTSAATGLSDPGPFDGFTIAAPFSRVAAGLNR